MKIPICKTLMKEKIAFLEKNHIGSDEKLKTILKLRYGDGLKYEDIAKKINTSKQSIYFMIKKMLTSVINEMDASDLPMIAQCIIAKEISSGNKNNHDLYGELFKDVLKRFIKIKYKKNIPSATVILKNIDLSGVSFDHDISQLITALNISPDTALIIYGYIYSSIKKDKPHPDIKIGELIETYILENEQQDDNIGVSTDELVEVVSKRKHISRAKAKKHIKGYLLGAGHEKFFIVNKGRYTSKNYLLSCYGEVINDYANVVLSYFKDKKLSCCDTRILIEDNVINDKSISSYLLRSLLSLSGKFKKEGKTFIVLMGNSSNSEQKCRSLDSLLFDCYRKKMAPLTARDLERCARENGRLVHGITSAIVHHYGWVRREDGYIPLSEDISIEEKLKLKNIIESIVPEILKEYPFGFHVNILLSKIREHYSMEYDKFNVIEQVMSLGYGVYGKKAFMIIIPKDKGDSKKWLVSVSKKHKAKELVKLFGIPNHAAKSFIARIGYVRHKEKVKN